LEALAASLARKRPGAAASLREGPAETLTVNRLGVGGKLLQTLESTNPVESMIEIVRDHAGRVKRWSSGEMALRWAAAGMLAAEAQFRRVKGYQELPALAAALERATADDPALLIWNGLSRVTVLPGGWHGLRAGGQVALERVVGLAGGGRACCGGGGRAACGMGRRAGTVWIGWPPH
jgi:hypothetical protein